MGERERNYRGNSLLLRFPLSPKQIPRQLFTGETFINLETGRKGKERNSLGGNGGSSRWAEGEEGKEEGN